MKTVIPGLLGLVAIAVLLSGIMSYPARAEISCEFNVLPENDVIDKDAGDRENHRLNIKSLTPREQWTRGHVRVMISTLHDEVYHKGEQWYKDALGNPVLYDYQTEDKKAIISVEVWVPAVDSNPNGNGNEKRRYDEIEGCPVWILVVDPRDGSGYVTGAQDDNRDNRDHNTKHRGTLTVHDGFTATGDEIELTWGQPPNQTKNTVGLGVKLKYARPETGVDGKDWKVYHAKAILEITDRYGGDNYQILASVNQKLEDKWLDANKNPIVVNQSICPWDHRCSGTMYAWKRCYLEVDKMFRAGHYLTADAVVGATVIQLADVTTLNNGDKIRIFGVDEAGEEAVITAIDGPNKRITIDTDPQTAGNQGLTKAYQKGAGNNEAAVGKLVYNGGQLDEAATFFLADTSLVKPCYDPGFAEFKELPDGAGVMPHQTYAGDDARLEESLREFSQRWFKHKENREEDVYSQNPVPPVALDTGEKNCFHIAPADLLSPANAADKWGISYYSMNAVYVFVGNIENHCENVASAVRKAYCHEMGHQFDTNATFQHCPNNKNAYSPPPDGEKCIMVLSTPWAVLQNGRARFCLDHILVGFGPPAEASLRDEKDER